MRAQGVWSYVNGTRPRLVDPGEGAPAEDIAEYKKELGEWISGDEKAHGIMTTSISLAI